ncbi:hypothetical protein KAW18_11020 [candidate division WOR-3 bacterium]|nr:hypothetical protein [candidate division WOR-3 bacterium]
MSEMEYPELECIIDDLRDSLKYGCLSEAVTALGILSRYVDGLVKEQGIWRETEIKIIEERKK